MNLINHCWFSLYFTLNCDSAAFRKFCSVQTLLMACIQLQVPRTCDIYYSTLSFSYDSMQHNWVSPVS